MGPGECQIIRLSVRRRDNDAAYDAGLGKYPAGGGMIGF